MKRVAVFASGSGTNAERITRYFENHLKVKIEIILSNRKDAYVLERAKTLNVPTKVFSREQLVKSPGVVDWLKNMKIDLVVLAGFLWLIPDNLLSAFPSGIVNIHPALLPKYGGENMYGAKVHQSVIDAGEKESGITIHFVDEIYDHGEVIFQARCSVSKNETHETLAKKIHELEHKHYPEVIEKLLIG